MKVCQCTGIMYCSACDSLSQKHDRETLCHGKGVPCESVIDRWGHFMVRKEIIYAMSIANCDAVEANLLDLQQTLIRPCCKRLAHKPILYATKKKRRSGCVN